MSTSPDTVTDGGSLEHIPELIDRDPQEAARRLREHLGGDPLDAKGYRLLAQALAAIEQRANSRGELRTFVRGADPLLNQAAAALAKKDLETAEVVLRKRLLERPAEPVALFLMGRLAHELDFDDEAEDLLWLAIELAPDFFPARFALASALDGHGRHAEVVSLMDEALTNDPGQELASFIKAAALGRAGRFDESLALYERLIATSGNNPKLWLNYGLILKTKGRSDDGLRAMRQAVEVDSHAGEAWWNLSNLKTVKFGAEDISAMTEAIEDEGLGEDDRLHIHFALGKAFEDSGDTDQAFGHYAKANQLRRIRLNHDPDDISKEVAASTRFFTREFFEKHAGQGCPAPDPIFIVGMPRSGSTLVEQILASHPAIEGTTELPDIGFLAKKLGRRHGDYFGKLSALSADAIEDLGEEYLARTRPHRVEGRIRFIDKMPNNWVHVPLIHLILPNSKIIDARRHPLATGFSNFKQHYARGQAFSYDLGWMGRYYADYVRMMAHVEEVLPGRVHRVIHERLVEDTEAEIRRMLDYLGLPFDDACLRFYETERAVRTPSSEQVRRPISREGLEAWRKFDPWLTPLKEALGPVLDAYPDAPDFQSV
ncbi:tetratricopeptide repeat-containing sulfotransferase family protein [Sphingomonas hankyongi]|uniref:Sulfotransferase n=1 Tax=Sphingomonas hankyongi TaxID=2908209 RepID=A0ABT0S2H3_9SPHN|nr:sulfotransferase [Sphingomonas hankyongi]MCL6730053.1 sulfotransferase [Sphingomonas hankyongi]